MSSIHTSKSVRIHETIWSLKLSDNPISVISNQVAWNSYTNSPVSADCISFSATNAGSFCRIQSPNLIAGLTTISGKRVVLRYLCKNTSNSQPSVAIKYNSIIDGGSTIGINGVSGIYDWTEVSVAMTLPIDAKVYEVTVINNAVVGYTPFGNCYITGIRFTTFGQYQIQPTKDPSYNSTISGCRGFNVEHYAQDDESQFYELRTKYNCNIIRFPLNRYNSDGFNDAATNMNTYDLWFDSMIVALDKFLDKCKRHDMKIVVDYHFPPGGWNLISGVQQALEYSNIYYDKFIEKWKFLANKLKDNPAIYAFDILNEPTYLYQPPPQGPAQKNWYTLTIDAVREIRKIDPNRTIIFEMDGYGDPKNLDSISPIPFDNVIYSCHMYQPAEFWNVNNTSSVTYPGSIVDGVVLDKQFLRNVLQRTRDFQLSYKIPTIFVGEFAPYRWNPGAALWIRDLIDIFEEYGWIYTYFVYKVWQDVDLDLENEKGTTVVSLSGTDRQRVVISALSANNSLYTSAEQYPIAPSPTIVDISNKNSYITWNLPDCVSNEFVVEWKDTLSSTYSNIHTSAFISSAITSAHIPGSIYNYNVSLVNKYGSATTSATRLKNVSYIKNLTDSNIVKGFSLKRLTSAYTGPLIRVRRSTDDTEQDIYSISGNNVSAGFLNISALQSFIGANTGYVVTWYDQFGGNHISNPNKLRQPIVISAGVLIQDNSYPSIYFNNNILSGTTTNFKSMSATTFIGILKNISTNAGSYIAGDCNTTINASRYFWVNGSVKSNEVKLIIINDVSTVYSGSTGSLEVSSFTSGVSREVIVQDNRTNIKIASNKNKNLTVDNTYSSQLSSTTLTTDVFCVGGFFNTGTPGAYVNCNISELIFLNTVLTNDDYNKLMYSGISTYDLQ